MIQIFHRPTNCLLAALMMIVISNGSLSAQGGSTNSGGWKHLRYAIFFTAEDVQSLLADSVQFKSTMEYFAPVKPVRVYLQGAEWNGKLINTSLLKELANRFRKMGIEADAALVPISPRGTPSVYNDKGDLESLKERTQALAKIFNRIILDDWLFTTATDPKSVEDRGNLTWAEYRTRTILKQSKRYIIDAAKEVNPRAQVIIKFPNWYEGFAENGYDVYGEVRQFDKMAIGIETRVPETQHQHIPIYSGYVLQKWESSVDPTKWVGSWLDNYEMEGKSNEYNAQVWQAILAGTPEIILWSAGQLWPTNPSSNVYPDFVDKLPDFDRVAGLLTGHSRGVPIYLPYGSNGEYNIFGYLGMIGIPLEPVATFPKESQNAIFCLNSLKDTNLADEMLDRLRGGKDVFMTFRLWEELARRGTEFKNALSLLPYKGDVSSSTFSLLKGFHEIAVKADRSFTFPGVEATTWPESRDVTLSREDYDFSVLMKVPYLNGTIYVLNMPNNSYDLLELPTEVLDAIREPFEKEIGVVLNGQGHVGIYLFGDKEYVLYNMSNKVTPVSLRFHRDIPTTGWQELVHNEQLRIRKDTTIVDYSAVPVSDVCLTLQPHEITVIKAP